MLVQRVLCLVANISNSITQERRQIAWSRLNPVIKDVPVEEDKRKKSVTLFGESFTEKATKRMKALTKFTNMRKEITAAKRCKYAQDPSDLCRFLEKGAPAQYGSRKHQLYGQGYNRSHNPDQNHKHSSQTPKKHSKH